MSQGHSTNALDCTNVPIPIKKDVPFRELAYTELPQKHISKNKVEELAIEKYRKCGRGIKFIDITRKFDCSKRKAQRILKDCCQKKIGKTGNWHQPILFRAVRRTSPQEYFPTSIKAEILEDLKKRKNVPIDPTGVNLSNDSLFSSKNPLSNAIEYQKAQSFLDVLLLLPFTPPNIHKLQLMFPLDKEYYRELKQNEQPTNRAKSHEENIGRRRVTYRLSPNGTVEVAISTTDTPFRIEQDEDMSEFFSFLGQVRDRFLYHVSDMRERHVPSLLNWILKQCDLNKDVEIDDRTQIALPDIQLKSADRVFRTYIKIMKDKAYCRVEESLTLNQILPEALDNIRRPYKSIENKIDKLTELLGKNTSSQR